MTLHLDGAVESGGFRVEATLHVEAGETVALVGPNGAGKSTLLRAIAGLERLAEGAIRWNGEVWDEPGRFVAPADRSVGVMFQDHLLFDHLTALDNVAFGMRAAGTSAGIARTRAADLLAQLGIAAVGAHRPRELSGGQAQRVALARALAIDPVVLLLDEPLASLDVSAREAVRHDLAAWLSGHAAGPARLLVTHDPVDAHALADRVVVLEAGRVTQRGTLAELAAAPRSDYVADLMGTNVVRGVLTGHILRLADGTELTVGAHHAHDGAVIAAVSPRAISLHRDRPEGSPRNVWQAEIGAVDRSLDRVRVRLAGSLPLVVEVTEAGLAALGAALGDVVWASVKASEITVDPA